MAGGQGIGRARSVAGELPVATRAVLGAGRGVGGVLGNAGGELRAIAEGMRTPAGAVDVLAGMTPFGTPVQVGTQLARDPSAGLGSAMARTAMPLDLVEQSPGWSSAVSNAVGQLADLLTASRELGTPGGWQNVSRRSRERLGKMVGGIGKGFYDAPVASTLGFVAPAIHMASAHAPVAGVADNMGLVAYHGSPTKFPRTQNNPFGEFSLEHIGSGEGAQFYGYGQYLAESPKVAKTYMAQDKSKYFLSPRAISVGERTFMNNRQLLEAASNARNSSESAMYHILSAAYDLGIDTKPKLKAAIQKSPARFGAWTTSTRAFDDAVKMVMKKDVSLSSQKGHLYTVDLPDDHVSTMIDWDSPVSKQNPLVAKVASEQGVADGTGMDIYKSLSSSLGSDRAASEYLLSKGISGLYYFDRTSRLKGIGTRNFVVFDPSIITITNRK